MLLRRPVVLLERDSLVNEVCTCRWATTAARTQAQRLVCRLERLLNPGMAKIAPDRRHVGPDG
jgi:hypothetical protein